MGQAQNWMTSIAGNMTLLTLFKKKIIFSCVIYVEIDYLSCIFVKFFLLNFGSWMLLNCVLYCCFLIFFDKSFLGEIASGVHNNKPCVSLMSYIYLIEKRKNRHPLPICHILYCTRVNIEWLDAYFISHSFQFFMVSS